MSTSAQISHFRLLPVVVLDDVSSATTLGDALVAGGLPVAEITFRTAAAADAIRVIAERGDILVGAGTVTTAEQAEQAVHAGATFLVSPGLSRTVVERAGELGVPVFPGIATATELMAAIDLGISTVKFFPAAAAGGVALIRALAAPFPQARFVPTGGVSVSNLADYLSLPAVAAVGGSWMVPRDRLAAGDTAAITELVHSAVELAAQTPGSAR